MSARLRNYFLSIINLYLLLALCGTAISLAQSKREMPLTLTQILTGLQTEGKTVQTKTLAARNTYIIKRIRERGIDFELDDDDERDLLDAGATHDLISAIRNVTESRETPNAAAAKQKREIEADAYFKRGQQCADDDYDCRIANFTKAIASSVEYAPAYFYRGLANAKKNYYDEAINDYTRAIELNREDALAYNNRGVVFAKKGDFRQAINDYDRAIELSPRDCNTFNNRGNAYAKINDFEMAIYDYNRAIKLNPKLAVAFKSRGNAYYNLKNYDRAIDNYNQAVKLDPKNVGYILLRADAYFSKRDYHQAIYDYTLSIKLDPNNSHAYELRSYAYEQTGQRAKARQDSQIARELKRNR
jgi:tetratricopeptide (TPR) repeat protein